jgi:hypothetical protein
MVHNYDVIENKQYQFSQESQATDVSLIKSPYVAKPLWILQPPPSKHLTFYHRKLKLEQI